MSAVLGGTQSLHTNSYDEAVGLPTDESATIALRTQQILANESGMTDTVDPFAGSYFIEALTDELEAKATELFDRVEQIGGAVRAIEEGFMQRAIEDAAYAEARRQESGDSVVVGVNRFALDAEPPIPVLSVDPELERAQIERLRRWRESRDAEAVTASLERIESVARGSDNLLSPIRESLSTGATVGEVSDALRRVFGVHRPS
jgi:methylmalonyl-CoA mutase N-terminal domain/subunit